MLKEHSCFSFSMEWGENEKGEFQNCLTLVKVTRFVIAASF